MKLSFEVIFSIILIVVFLFFGFYVIGKFIDTKNSIEIVNIEGLKKDELLLRIKVNGNEQLLVAYKKKKISENEIIKTAKKASEMNLRYSILSMGELPKKISGLIKALQNINDIKKVE